MSPLIIILIILVLYFCSKPRFRPYIERDGLYLSRSWTSFVNAMFITLVVCSHGLHLFQTSIRDFFPEKITASGVGLFGQLMVTTFFFYSGYGIMLSLLNRGGYARKLIFPRFVSLLVNFISAVMVYFVIHSILQGQIQWWDFLGGLHEYSVLGNPTWFILMTLLTYALTFACCIFIGTKHPAAFILGLTILLMVLIYLISKIKPGHWVNTILCFPAGMLYYLKGEQLESLIRKTRIPSIVYAVLLLTVGKLIYAADLWPDAYTENIGGILFALGITWLTGSFSWDAPSRFLIWLGGSGLFVVYMFHLLPMRILTQLKLNAGPPYLVWLYVVVATSIFCLIAQYGYRKLNRILFQK